MAAGGASFNSPNKWSHGLAGDHNLFEDLAAEHSICSSSKRGGEMGWIKQGMGLPPLFEDAIFDAEIEEIFTTDSHKGLHIVQVLDEK
jgi:parvulin-like peptidyl-prolyl isomerase